MGCHFLLQGIFPTQGLNLGLPHCGQTLYHLSHQGSLSLLIGTYFPGGTSGKEPTCQFRRHKILGFDPWRKISWRRKWQPTPAFLPEESHGQGSLASYHGVAKCQTWLKQLSAHAHTHTYARTRARIQNKVISRPQAS